MIFVSVLLSMVLSVSSNSIHNIRQAKEIAQRRQYVGYTSNVVHENPNYPDQTAESTVKVNFNQVEPRPQIYVTNPYANQELAPAYTQNYPTNAPQSQLFNVGYSVSFTNGERQSKPPPPPKYTRTTNLDNGEIITGTRKRNEEVQVPTINLSPQEYVSSALISGKKQKISGIKAKPHFVSAFPNPKVLLSQANLSPSTQKYYKALEQVKPQVQNTQELQQKYTWRNLSPGVEIIRSTEVPAASHKYTRTEQHFDHAKALGRSQDFDYSNAVDNSNAPQQNTLYYSHLKKPQFEQAPIVIGANVPKLPMDTSLLREQIPIQVDTRFVDEAMRNAFYGNSKFSQVPEQTVQEVNYAQQAYRTIPVQETQSKPVQVVYQQAQAFQEYDPTRFQYKIYGKAQPVPGGFNERQEEQIQRQPRFVSDIHTNLRPPPFATVYQKRIRVG
jgi:hypothetical protein